MGEIKKIKALIILQISIIICLNVFDLTHFRGYGSNPSKNLASFLGDLKKQKFPSEII